MEPILRARTVGRVCGKFRQTLVKWVSEVDPSWEPVENIQETIALERFEALYGPIDDNDGPFELKVGKNVGPREPKMLEQKRQRRTRNIKRVAAEEEGVIVTASKPDVCYL